MRRVGPLPSSGLEVPLLFAGLQQRVQESMLGRACHQPGAKRAEHREVEAGVDQFEPQRILPVNAAPYRLGRLPIREPFGKLHDRHQRQPPGRFDWPTAWSEQIGELRIVVDAAEEVAHLDIHIPLRKRRAGDTDGLLRDRAHRGRMQRHGWLLTRYLRPLTMPYHYVRLLYA